MNEPPTAAKAPVLDCLVVDDDPLIRLCLEHMVREAGHRVTGAGDGEAAQVLVSGHSYDLVITDIRMPKSDGWALFRHVREVSPRTQVILMTAYPTAPDAESAVKFGAFEYLAKPIDGSELGAHLRRLVQRSEAN